VVWGCPEALLSDNGSQFASHEFQDRCAQLGIRRLYSTPYHPESNGVIEAFHQFLIRTMAVYVRLTSWPLEEVVATVLWAYRSTPHPATGETPQYLMAGLDTALPHQQDWTYGDGERVDSESRFRVLAQVRRQCFETMVRKTRLRPYRIGPVTGTPWGIEIRSHREGS